MPLLFAALFPPILASRRYDRVFAIGLAACGVGGALIELAGASWNISGLLFAGSVAMGLFTGAAIALLADDVGHLPSRTVGLVVSAGYILQAVLDLAIASLPPLATTIIVCVLPILCLACLLRSGGTASPLSRGSSSSAHGKRSVPALPEPKRWRGELRGVLRGLTAPLLLAFALYWLACGYYEYRFAINAFSTPFQQIETPMMARGLAAALFFLGSACFHWRQQSILRIGLLLMIAGGMSISVIEAMNVSSQLSVFIIFAGYGMFDIMSWVVLANIARYRDIPSTRTIGAGMAISCVAMALGVATEGSVAPGSPLPSLQVAIDNLMTYGLVVGAVLALVDLSGIWNMSIEALEPVEARREDLTSLADSHWLTDRETDVLLQLLTDKKVGEIAQDMHISKNTLNTHIKRIYVKFDVHSRDELIDLADAFLD